MTSPFRKTPIPASADGGADAHFQTLQGKKRRNPNEVGARTYLSDEKRPNAQVTYDVDSCRNQCPLEVGCTKDHAILDERIPTQA